MFVLQGAAVYSDFWLLSMTSNLWITLYNRTLTGVDEEIVRLSQAYLYESGC